MALAAGTPIFNQTLLLRSYSIFEEKKEGRGLG